MLCFLPPVVAAPRERPIPRPRDPGSIAGIAIACVATLAVLFPIGCVKPLPAYAARVGEEAALGPRPVDRDLSRRLHRGDGVRAGPPTFFASRDAYGAGTPPGLRVDPATGALVGVPTVAGSYLVAIGVSNGGKAVIGPAFQIKVLPPARPRSVARGGSGI